MSILNPGDLIFHRYRVEEFVGQGGMQEVYRASDEALSRTVALKTPKNDHAAKRFQKSAKLSAAVQHPSVAATLDYFEENGRAYMAEEFIRGVDLKKVMAEVYFYLDPALGAHIATHLAKALAACHRKRIWHRDLKPANIMVASDLCFSFVKITDFGVAKLVEDELEAASSVGSSIAGSPTLLGALPFMAPECLTNPGEAHCAADVWSFGAILYYLLCGKLPFGEGPAMASVPAILVGRYGPPPAWIASKTQFAALFQQLWEVIVACLAVDPTRRPTAEQIVDRLVASCYFVHERFVGTTKDQKIKGGKGGFITTPGKDVMYHLDSVYRDGGFRAGEKVAFSKSPGAPSERAFPVIPVR